MMNLFGAIILLIVCICLLGFCVDLLSEDKTPKVIEVADDKFHWRLHVNGVWITGPVHSTYKEAADDLDKELKKSWGAKKLGMRPD